MGERVGDDDGGRCRGDASGRFYPSGASVGYNVGMSEGQKAPSFEELYRQLRALPADRNGEVVAGELIITRQPTIPSVSIRGEIIADLRPSFSRQKRPEGAPPRWWILSRPEVHLQARGQTHVVTPALVGWTRERMPVLPNGDYTTLTPDWICEILSPATERFDRKTRMKLYLDAGVTWHWLVSPRARTVEAYRREGAFWMQLGVWTDEDVVAIEPFSEFELKLWSWWDGLEPIREEP